MKAGEEVEGGRKEGGKEGTPFFFQSVRCSAVQCNGTCFSGRTHFGNE